MESCKSAAISVIAGKNMLDEIVEKKAADPTMQTMVYFCHFVSAE